MQSKRFKLSPVDTNMLTWKISIFSSHHLTDFKSAFMTFLFNKKQMWKMLILGNIIEYVIVNPNGEPM